MKMSRAAYRYAKAALKFASKESEALGDDMDQALALLEAHEDVASFLENPLLPAKAKKETLIKLIPQHTKAFAQLLEVLASNNRLSILEAVARQYKKWNELQQGQLSATVVTAIPLTPVLKAEVLEKAKSITSKKIQLQNQVEPSIMGGFILTLGDMQYDASVAHKLKGIKTALLAKQ